jgi:hypothetical protein
MESSKIHRRILLACCLLPTAFCILAFAQGGTGKLPPIRKMPPPIRNPPPRKNPPASVTVSNRGLLRTVNLAMPPDDPYSCNAITRKVRVQGSIDTTGKLVDWKPDRGCPTHLNLITKDLELQRFTPATQDRRFVKSVGFVDYVFAEPISKQQLMNSLNQLVPNDSQTAIKNEVSLRGVNFRLTSLDEMDLRRAGARDELIAAVRENFRGGEKDAPLHTANIQVEDGSNGLRVRISADRSLNDYEAYHRGDRFYVKLPAVEIPRTEIVRGPGFSDVRVQRSSESTVVSFRLTSGWSAHVEQSSSRLTVVFTR